jgi:hypothetical protein
MANVSANIKLIEAYRKQPVRVRLAPRKDMGQLAPQDATLDPVLYHGTARVQVLAWQQKGEIRAPRFSLSSLWFTAAQYATYRIRQVFQDSDTVFLQNSSERKIWTTLERVVQTKVCAGFVTNSIAFFDTESVLKLPESQFEKQAEEVAGLRLQRKSKLAVIPFDLLIAVLSFLPWTSPYLEVFNRELWDANFSVPPQSLEGMPSWTTAECEPFPAEILQRILGE